MFSRAFFIPTLLIISMEEMDVIEIDWEPVDYEDQLEREMLRVILRTGINFNLTSRQLKILQEEAGLIEIEL
jgi:hypothetical protein